MIIPNIWKNQKCSSHHQPEIHILFLKCSCSVQTDGTHKNWGHGFTEKTGEWTSLKPWRLERVPKLVEMFVKFRKCVGHVHSNSMKQAMFSMDFKAFNCFGTHVEVAFYYVLVHLFSSYPWDISPKKMAPSALSSRTCPKAEVLVLSRWIVCTFRDISCTYNIIWHTITKFDTMQYNTIQYNTMQCNAMQCNTIQYNTIQYNTIIHHMCVCMCIYIYIQYI